MANIFGPTLDYSRAAHQPKGERRQHDPTRQSPSPLVSSASHWCVGPPWQCSLDHHSLIRVPRRWPVGPVRHPPGLMGPAHQELRLPWLLRAWRADGCKPTNDLTRGLGGDLPLNLSIKIRARSPPPTYLHANPLITTNRRGKLGAFRRREDRLQYPFV